MRVDEVEEEKEGRSEEAKEGGEEEEEAGGGVEKKGSADLDEETSLPSFSCRQKAQIPLGFLR